MILIENRSHIDEGIWAMELRKVVDRGRELGLSSYEVNLPKKLLIRSIQRAQGVDACFLTDHRFSCGKERCEWKEDCKKLTAAWLR